MALTTLLDIAKLNGCDNAIPLIEEVLRWSPEVEMGSARTIKGTNYRARVRTSLPTAGFRSANAGVTASKSTFENRLFETYMLNPKWFCDKAVADRYEDGAQAFIAMEALGIMQASMISLSKQFYYGRSSLADTAGFPGLVDMVDSTSMVKDVTGSTVYSSASAESTTNMSTSVWAINWGIQDVSWLWGNNGQLVVTPAVEVPNFTDPNATTTTFTAYHQELLAYPGLQVGNKWACARAYNVTGDTGKGCTDKVLGNLRVLFPPQKQPMAYFMTTLAQEQLRQSRTATNPTGAPAPIPTDYMGTPIYVTNGISNQEAIIT